MSITPSRQSRPDVRKEMFSDEFGTVWIVKGDRTPTAAAAIAKVTEFEAPPENTYQARLRRARIEWRDDDGWWLTCDDAGEYEVWEVDDA